MARKPSFDFERRERAKLKAEKRTEKAKAKAEKKTVGKDGEPDQAEAEGDAVAADDREGD